MSKNIFQSKTFWVNLVTLAVTVAGYLPAKYAAIALPLVNMALRFITTDPVHLFSALVIALALVAPVSLRAATATPAVEAGVFHQCGVDGKTKNDAVRALNHLKNRAGVPTQLTDVELVAFYEPGDDTHRFDTDTPLRVRGWVTKIKPGEAESVNCGATEMAYRDTHIELHRDLSSTDLPVIVEVTPRWRAAMKDLGEDWSTSALRKALQGHLVEFEGWPLLDAEHLNAAETTHPGGAHNWRQTAWEPAHPVTAFRVIQ